MAKENAVGWKAKRSGLNTIVGTSQNPTEFESGQVIINKKSTKKNLDKLIEINNDGKKSNAPGKVTNDATDGGLLKGPPHYDEKGKPTGGIPGIVDGGKMIETEGDEFVVNKEASEEHWKELSKINQAEGNGVAINPPSGIDDDPQEFKEGGKIEFNPNKLPKKSILKYAEMIRTKHPEIWKLGGNIFGNQAFKNLKRVSERGYWEDSEEWMYIKWRSYVARHIHDFRIEGVVAMLKWVDTVEKGWPYMKQLIEEQIKKVDSKSKSTKMKTGGSVAQTPAPKKDQIKGSDVNKSGSSATTKSASSIKFDEKTIESINNKVKEHNDAHPDKKITLASAKAVVRRGMGAYSSSHRPTITGGKPNSRVAWGIARLNAFTYKIVHGKSKSGKYTQDDDLIEELGYSVAKMKDGGNVEYQYRDLSGTMVYYKRKSGGKWDFISKDEFDKNANQMNTVLFKNGGSTDNSDYFIPANGTLMTKDKKTKLDYNKVGNDYEFSVFDGEPNPVENYSRVQYKKRSNNKVLMNYNQFVDYLYNEGYIDDKFKNGGETMTNTEKLIQEITKNSNVEYGVVSTTTDGEKYRYVRYRYKNPISPSWLVMLFNKAAEENGKKYGTQFLYKDYSFHYDRHPLKNMPNGSMGFKVLEILPSDFAHGGSVDAKDTVTVDIPLMIRLLELSREDIHSDAELHMVVERLLDLKNKPVLTMDDYSYIAEIEHKHLQKMALGGNLETEKLISQAHTNLTVKKGRRDYAPTSTEIQEEIDRMIMEEQFGSTNI